MTIGIVGAGQLGRMLALAGYPLGLDVLFLDHDAATPGGQVGPILTGSFTDAALLAELARRCEVITFDWENVSVEALAAASARQGARLAPPLAALATSQDRLLEKELFTRLRIPTTRFAPVSSLASLHEAVTRIGLPGMLKTRRMGYDGKGQRTLRHAADCESAWHELGDADCIYEERVPFDFEVSIIGARRPKGEIVVYPLNRNEHRDGILRLTRAPWRAPKLARAATAHLKRIMRTFDYAGVLTVEFFVRGGRLIANEIAPRVHNSGHWTIEGARTSQFANHMRAILDLPLGDTTAVGHCAMINLIGRMPERGAILGRRGVFLHDYGKTARPGRKVGHCTLVESGPAMRNRRARLLLARLESK